MNFLSLRNELQNWTLNSDDKLYQAIKALSETVLDAEKAIINNIQTTKYEVIKGNVESGCSYNQYLRISESKFTQNKIGQKKSAVVTENTQIKKEPRNKMDIFKEAIQIGTKNLQITQQKGGDADLVSVSDSALSQSIYKDCRVPAFYGTKQFATNSFLNLFTQNQLNATIPCQNFETNQLLVNTQMQESSSLPPPPSLQVVGASGLAPPPSLDLVLNQMNYNVSPSSLPPPPTLRSLPPPPSLGNLPPPPKLDNLPPPPPLSNLLNPSSLPPPPSLGNLPPPPSLGNLPSLPTLSNDLGPTNQNEFRQQNAPVAPASEKPKQPLSVQEELMLRIKLGKNYKKQIDIKQQEVTKPTRETSKEQVRFQEKQRLPQITQDRQSLESGSIRNSIRNSYGGVNLNPFINSNSSKPPVQEEQQVDSFYWQSKNKKETKKTVPTNLTDDIMKRQTFNEDILFKKKTAPEKKQIPKPKNNLFADDGDEQSIDISFKKKQKKQQIKPKPVLQTKKKGLLDSDSEEDNSNLFKKKPEVKKVETKEQIKIQIKKEVPVKVQKKVEVPTAQKKPMNPLFMPSKPAQVQVKITQSPEKANQKLEVKKQQQTTSIRRESSMSSHASTYAMKAAAAGGYGMMGMGMGMGMPLLPKGMALTKPSEAKKNQQQALKRIKQEEQQQRLAKIQQQKRLQQERQKQRVRQQQIKRQMQLQQQQNRRIKELKQRSLQMQQANNKPVSKIEVKQQSQKINLPAIPSISPAKNPMKPKKNSLFDDQEDGDDFFKYKPKKITQNSEYVPQQQPKVDLTQSQKAPISQFKQEQKVNEVKIEVQIPKQNKVQVVDVVNEPQNQLATRRKKAKPIMKAQNPFQDEDEAKKISLNIKNVTVVGPSQQQKQRNARQAQQKKRQQENRIRQQRQLEERAMAERKRQQQQQQAKQRQEFQRQQRLKKQKQQQQIRKAEQLRRQQQQRQQRQQKIRRQQEQRRAQQLKLQQQQQLRVQQQRRQQEQRRIQQQRRAQQQRILQQQKRRQQLQREQRLRRQEQERLKRQKQQEENRIRQQQERRKAEQLKNKDKAPFLPKLPSRTQPLGGPLGGPSLPKLGKPAQKPGIQAKKSSLFDGQDNQQAQLAVNKPVKTLINKAPTNNTGIKKGLFDDDDDLEDNFLVGKKPAPKPPKQQAPLNKQSKLFNQQQDDGLGIIPKSKIMAEPAKQPMASKQQGKKKSLFDDDDDQIGNNFLKKPQAKIESKSPAPINQPSPQKQPSKIQPVHHSTSPSPLQQAPKPVQPIQQASGKKKSLFDDDDDDDFLNIKKQPVAQKQPIATQQPTQPAFVPKQAPAAQPKKKNLFDDSGSDDSFSKQQERKKRQAAKRLKGFN